jgi:hypothetical protein
MSPSSTMSPSGPGRRLLRRSLPTLALTTLMALASALPVVAQEPAGPLPQRHGAAERLALRLLNCTRTGGWVRRDGTCRDRGSGKHSARRPALRLRSGLSDSVAFGWAAQLATVRVCAHSLDGQPDLALRFSSAGYRDPYIGENIGCAWGGTSARDMVVRTHLSMQAEKRTRGGHWLNIKNRGYRSVGIGVASLDGWSAVVYDFYGR